MNILFLPWPVIWYVVLLDFLRNVIRLRHVGPPVAGVIFSEGFHRKLEPLTISMRNLLLDKRRGRE